MKKRATFSVYILIFVFFCSINVSHLRAQSYLVGPPDPFVGANANYTTHNHFNLFDVINPTGIYIDSITIYPSAAATSYTVVVQNSSQQQIASYTGISTVGGNQAERIKADLFVPQGVGYRMGLTPTSAGMLRNSTGITYPYTVPGVISFTNSTFTGYWYFFYNLRVRLPVYQTDAALTAVTTPADTTCSGLQPVTVTLKNFGPSSLTSAELHWTVNNTAQPVFNWSGSLGVLDSTTVVLGHYDLLAATTYNIMARVFEPNGLADTVTHNDTIYGSVEFVKPSPEATFTTAAVTTICQGDSIVLTGTLTGTPPWHLSVKAGTTTHQFPSIQTSPFSMPFHPSTTTTYILTAVSDATGCSSEPNDTIEVLVAPQPPAFITPPSPSSICAGDSIVLMGSVGAGFSYEWHKDGVLIPGASGFILVAKESGGYTVNVTSPNGCKKLSDLHQLTVHPLPDVFLGNDTAVLPGVTLTLDAGGGFNTYLWSTGQTTQAINVDSTGVGIGIKTVWVEVTDNYSCQGRDEININFTPHPGIGEILQGAQMSVYPNPGQGVFTLLMEGVPAGDYHLEVLTLRGGVVYREPIHYGFPGEKITLDLSPLSSGAYYLIINGAHGAAATKVIIQR